VIPSDDVDDITQEVFLAAVKSLSSFRGESQFGTWLRTLTNHKIAEYYRRRNRKKEIQSAPLHEAFEIGDGSTAGTLEEQIAIRRALQELPENYREVLLLRFAEDMQFNEIADVMKQNLEATKSLFRRAVAALRNQLEKDL
jgi:RNA polymerase sigma-70 factor (ECF subfamily)